LKVTDFYSILNVGNKFNLCYMKTLSDAKADDLKGGAAVSSCAYNIVFSSLTGGLFGGAGAIVGAALAATGPSCLALW
jgi:hypothetical protein